MISAYIDIITTVPPGVPSYTLTLTVTYNDSTPVVVNLTSTNLSTSTDSYILTPSIIGQETTFSEGIYKLELVKSDDNSKESVCIPIITTLQCRVMEYVANLIKQDKDLDYILLLLELLYKSNECADCNCEDALIIYNHILETLNTDTILEDCECTD